MKVFNEIIGRFWVLQVELRDVDSGNKTTERFRTDEAIERMPLST